LELNDLGTFEITDVVALGDATQVKCNFVTEKKSLLPWQLAFSLN
jgi:hypothetical protein